MKKFIIGFICILLFSCHPIAVTFASVTENEVITLGTQQEMTLCKDIAAFAYISMTAHQNGVSEEDQLAVAPVPTNQDGAVLKVLLDGIVHDANMFPVYKDQEDKIEISERFSSVIYDICNGSK
jgi:hypothetical protein